MRYTIVAKMDGIKQMWFLSEPWTAGSVIEDDVIRDDLGTLKFVSGRRANGEPILSVVNGQIKRVETI